MDNTQKNNQPAFYMIGDIINLIDHHFKQKVELRVYNTKNDKIIGQCDFAVNGEHRATLCYIAVEPPFMRKHIGTSLIEVMHFYLAQNGVTSVNGFFAPDPYYKWPAEAFYRKNNYAIVCDELLLRKITKEDLEKQHNVLWRTTTLKPKAKLMPLEEITVNNQEENQFMEIV